MDFSALLLDNSLVHFPPTVSKTLYPHPLKYVSEKRSHSAPTDSGPCPFKKYLTLCSKSYTGQWLILCMVSPLLVYPSREEIGGNASIRKANVIKPSGLFRSIWNVCTKFSHCTQPQPLQPQLVKVVLNSPAKGPQALWRNVLPNQFSRFRKYL